MDYRLKLFLMFAPLVVFFVALFFLVGDMRHPVVSRDQCMVTAVGTDVKQYKTQGHYIYKQSDSPLNDVSLHCERMGTLLLNDAQLFITPIGAGQAAEVSRSRYRYLPERWKVNVTTGFKKFKENSP